MLGSWWLGSEVSLKAVLIRRVVLAGLVLLGVLAATAGQARAEFGVLGFDGRLTDAAGDPLTQAGGHPYALGITIDFNRHLETEFFFPGLSADIATPDAPAKTIAVDIPPGLVGNPTVVEQCPMELLSSLVEGTTFVPPCSPESQVGVVTLRTGFLFAPGGIFSAAPIPLYSIEPPPNVPARFGFNVAGVVVTLDASLRSGSDYGLAVTANNVSEGLANLGTDVTMWGTPADSSHDSERFCPDGSTGCSSTADKKPLLTIPTKCTAPGEALETSLHVDSWADPGNFKTAHFLSHAAPFYPDAGFPGTPSGITGCDKVRFDAALTAKPTNLSSPATSGYEFDLTMPQEDDPVTGLAPSHLKKAVVTLPEGVRVSPSQADGLEGCSSAQIKLSSTAAPDCPDGSKIGSLTIDTPLLKEQLTGSVYLATPFDNPSHTLLAVYLVAKGPGLIVKLPGSVASDAATGRISATFDNNPQLPFSKLHLEFNGGPRATLTNPPKCGTYTTSAELTSWSGKVIDSESSFTTTHDGRGAPCPPAGFTPGFAAGSVNPVAGASSPFTMTISRDDDDDELAAIRKVEIPSGLLARISTIDELCPEANAVAGTCPESSRIGTVTTAAGTGTHPFAVRGSVYFGGPYKGAPFSLSIVVPVVAGPFDLGTVVVRSAIFVDRHTADLDIVTDPLPTILEGIPLQVRLVHVLLDRPGFMLNPTSCAEKRIGAELVATTGRTAQVSTRFQVGNCSDLRLAPKISLRVGGKGHTQTGKSTPLTTVLRMPAGGSNLEAVKVVLPGVLNARLPVIEESCTPAQFDAGDCEQARAGTAIARTPLLKEPLRGGAYFVDNGSALPDLVVALRGQVDFDLIGKVSIRDSKFLATRFSSPDVPISSFRLKLVSGKNGPLGVATNLCSSRAGHARAQVSFRGQNGDVVNQSKRLGIAGCRASRRTGS